MTNLYHANNDELIPVSRKRLANEDQLQAWIACDPRLVGLDVLVLGREITTEFGGRIDVFALDREGNTVIIECKRDRTPRDIIAQILDYASWVSKLSTRQMHEIARVKLGKPLETAFQEHFGITLPESLNTRHSLVIVASEFDASSRRIVQYLAEQHELAINTAFFNTFEHQGQTLLTTDWLLDQEEVIERAENRAKAPWSGLWYYNVGQSESRSWVDMRRYGFIAAGGGRYYSDFLGKLSPDDRICAYQKQSGYVGFGIATSRVVPVREFLVNGSPLLKEPLDCPGLGHDSDNPDLCEYLVGIEWLKAVPIAEAKMVPGAFANQNIVCKLRDAATIEFLKRNFPLDAERKPHHRSESAVA